MTTSGDQIEMLSVVVTCQTQKTRWLEMLNLDVQLVLVDLFTHKMCHFIM